MFQNKNSASVRANSLFEGLDISFKINISQKDFVEKKEGEIIYQNGDNADYIYLILEGEVKQKISGVFTTPVIVKSNQNEFFGEKEVLENVKRSSSAVANTECLLYRLDKAAVNTLAGQNKTIKRNLYKSLLLDEPDENTPVEPQKKFFINADDSTQKFKIPDEKKENAERVEITHEDIAEIEKPAEEAEIIIENEVSPAEDIPMADEPLADELSAENYINIDKEPAEDIMAPQMNVEPDNLTDENIPEQQELAEQKEWDFSVPEEPQEETFLDEPLHDISSESLPDETIPLPEETYMPVEAENLTEEPVLSWQESQPPFEEEINSGEITSEENIASGDIFPSVEENTVEPASEIKSTEPEQQEPVETEKIFNSGKEIAGLISNDLLYPVSTIKFYADQIRKRNISPELNEVVGLLLEQATIVQDLADVVYDYTEERSSLNLETSGLNEVLDEVLGLLADFIESRSSRLYKKFESNAVVQLDKRKFYQAMFQIAKITCNTIPAGGNIYVVSSAESNYARIFINTTSLPKTDKTSAGEFSPLLTSGLGYLIAERIIKAHGGSILIEKTEEGSKLIISLPIQK